MQLHIYINAKNDAMDEIHTENDHGILVYEEGRQHVEYSVLRVTELLQNLSGYRSERQGEHDYRTAQSHGVPWPLSLFTIVEVGYCILEDTFHLHRTFFIRRHLSENKHFAGFQ